VSLPRDIELDTIKRLRAFKTALVVDAARVASIRRAHSRRVVLIVAVTLWERRSG